MAIIDKPTDYFETVTYTASTSSSYSETSLQFQPDFIWLKNRDTTYPHHLFDAVRGSSLGLSSNSTNAEQTRGSSYLTSFDSNGFTTGNAIASDSADGVVAWNWKAGTSFTNDASATGIGSIDSTGSVNTTSGFSIISYTGTGSAATVAHGLGVTPKVVMVKNLENATDWGVYNSNLTNANYLLYINLTHAETNQSSNFGTAPTSSVFTVNTNNSTNQSGLNHIAYCFNDVQGYSKFGSYVGNGSTDGTFVYTGFKPAFVMCKRTDAVRNWVIVDNKRPNYNPTNEWLYPNASDAGYSQTGIDLLSNGFKTLITSPTVNASGGSYIFMCFAENPFTTSTGVPTTAR